MVSLINHKTKWCFTVVLIAVLSLLAAAASGQGLAPTPYSMDVYGGLAGAETGDRVTVRDSDGVSCGEFTVSKPGRYGFLHVYGDDPSTAADEGAVYGDLLTFELNGATLTPLEGKPVRWQGDRQRLRVDF